MDDNFREFFGDDVKPKIDFSKLNKQQLEAVNTTEGPVLIIAGAGTGKTATITYRLAKLIEDGVNPAQILLLTFTNKAAKEMIERAQGMLDERVNKVTACTYHSFCVQILRKYYHLLDLDEGFSILSTSNCGESINLLKTRMGLDKDRDLPAGKVLASMFSFCTNKNMEISEILEIKYPKYEDKLPIIEQIQEEYTKYKLENNLVDYDDMLTLVNKLFRENPKICKRYSDQYLYIMVDEYQDSNSLQMELLKLLRQWDNKNICVVGDDFQSIYSFRGSNFKNIMRFPSQFEGTKIITLIKNYRSTQEILDLANALTINAPEKYDKQLIALRSKGQLPKLVYTNDTKEEAKYIFYKIWQYHMDGVPFKDIAVLIRSAQDSTQLELLLQEYASLRPVPFQKFGGLKFLEKEICQDILAYLSILNNSKGEVFWFRLFKLYQNIGQSHGSKLVDGVKKNGLEELIAKKHEGKKYGTYLPEIYNEYNKMKKISDVEILVDYLINHYYYKVKKRSIEESKIGTKSKTTTKADLLNKLDSDILEAQALITMAKGYDTIDSYLEALLLDSTDETETQDKLTISTVHSAKGLEFKIVFVMDCIDSTYPGERPLASYSFAAIQEHNEEIEESRRLLYVAITRAKEDLYLMYPNISIKYGKFEKTSISRFIEEDSIFKEYCEYEAI